MSSLVLQNVCKVYPGDHYAVRDFNLEIRDGEFIIFVGPSGCGKSTTLRMIAGLDEISEGELWIDGELMNYVEPRHRNLSMVFQNYALYPNMTVYGNMAYSLKVRKEPKEEIDRKVKETAKLLQIDHLLKCYPKALSGGQKQRVAIGSAMIRNPGIFLMDEPLSNLDAKLRAQMRVELSNLHKKLGSTIVYVTHDQTEAMTLGSRIVVMKEGKIQQVDTPQRLYEHPVNKFVAGFIGSPAMNFAEMKVQELSCYPGILDILNKNHYQKEKVILGIRPEDVYMKEELERHPDISRGPEIPVQIIACEMLGVEKMIYFDMLDQQFCGRVSDECDVRAGEKKVVCFDSNKIYLFDIDTEESIK